MVTKKMYSVKKDYKHTKFNTGEAFVKEGSGYRYFFPLNTKRRVKGSIRTVTFRNGKIVKY